MRLILKVATDRVQEQTLSVYLQFLNLRSSLSEKGCVILCMRLLQTTSANPFGSLDDRISVDFSAKTSTLTGSTREQIEQIQPTPRFEGKG